MHYAQIQIFTNFVTLECVGLHMHDAHLQIFTQPICYVIHRFTYSLCTDANIYTLCSFSMHRFTYPLCTDKITTSSVACIDVYLYYYSQIRIFPHLVILKYIV